MALFQGKCDSLRDKTKSKEDEVFFSVKKTYRYKIGYILLATLEQKKVFWNRKVQFLFSLVFTSASGRERKKSFPFLLGKFLLAHLSSFFELSFYGQN